jgi:hypothetical protein
LASVCVVNFNKITWKDADKMNLVRGDHQILEMPMYDIDDMYSALAARLLRLLVAARQTRLTTYVTGLTRLLRLSSSVIFLRATMTLCCMAALVVVGKPTV